MRDEPEFQKKVKAFSMYTYLPRKLILKFGGAFVGGVLQEEISRLETSIRSGKLHPIVAALGLHMFIGFAVREISREYAKSVRKKFGKSDQ